MRPSFTQVSRRNAKGGGDSSFVNTEITLFAYVNQKEMSDSWFLKVKSGPYSWSVSLNWSIVENINDEKGETSLDGFHSWDSHPA